VRESAFRKSFARSLKAARGACGLTQRDLADRAEIAEKYLSRLELGMATPSLHVAVRLARAVGVGLDELTAFSPAPTAGPKSVDLGPLLRLLQGRSAEDVERVRRVARELLR
jgi:transcriptional regulator with XRE-family HTH domain